jgi:hypothetical protein
MQYILVLVSEETGSLLKGKPFEALAAALQMATAISLSDDVDSEGGSSHGLGHVRADQVGVQLIEYEQSVGTADINIIATGPYSEAMSMRLVLWREALSKAVVGLHGDPAMCWGLKDKTVFVIAELVRASGAPVPMLTDKK